MNKRYPQAFPYQWLALCVALMLDIQIAWGTDGLPPLPRAWVLLWQTLPHLAMLWQIHGLTAGVAIAGLVALSVMQAALWLGFVLLLWYIGKGIMLWRRNVLPTPVTMPVQLAASTPTSDALPGDTTHRRAFSGPEVIPSPVLEGGERAMPLSLPSSILMPCLPASSSSLPHLLSPAPHRMPAPESVSVPVTLEAATVAAPTPWIACQVAVREGVMPDEHDEHGTGNVPYLACFAVEGCGSRDIIGDAVCERVLDVATAALVSRLTAPGYDSVESALRATLAEANHALVQDNTAQEAYLSASLTLCLLTAQRLWAISTGYTACALLQEGQWEMDRAESQPLFVGEQERLDEARLAVNERPLAPIEAILLGAGSIWHTRDAAWLADAWERGANGANGAETRCQRLVAEDAASPPSPAGAVAGLLMVCDGSVVSAATGALCTR
jgi:hypothetical protein